MNTVEALLYMVVIGAVRMWRRLTYVVIWVFIKPIKAHMVSILQSAGSTVNGTNPHDIQVHNEMGYHRVAHEGTLGFGESYIDGWWDCDKLDQLCTNLLRSDAVKFAYNPVERLINYLLFQAFNLQTGAGTWVVAEKHYDLGNELFSSFLGSSMSYSCAYWKDATNLDEAQQHKMELIAKKLKLRPGMRVLDMGCGWGSLSKYLAEKHGVQVVGITISEKGAQDARERCKGLDVEIRVQDYRDLNEGFDRIVVVEMMMHVGRQNYRRFFELAHRCLSEDGILLLHEIGYDQNDVCPSDSLTNKYFLPNTAGINHKDIPRSIDDLFSIEDWHSFGQYFDTTLMAWHENFVKNWHTISHLYQDPKRFYRHWTMYLLFGAAVFRSRRGKLWQIVLTKKGYHQDYISVR